MLTVETEPAAFSTGLLNYKDVCPADEATLL